MILAPIEQACKMPAQFENRLNKTAKRPRNLKIDFTRLQNARAIWKSILQDCKMPAQFENRFCKPARCPRNLKIDFARLFDSGKKIVEFDRHKIIIIEENSNRLYILIQIIFHYRFRTNITEMFHKEPFLYQKSISYLDLHQKMRLNRIFSFLLVSCYKTYSYLCTGKKKKLSA